MLPVIYRKLQSKTLNKTCNNICKKNKNRLFQIQYMINYYILNIQ